MSGSSIHLALGHLRRYVEESGLGKFELPAGPLTWEDALGPAVNDSRLAVPGALFVALPGEQTDGHQFIPAALAGGARAVIAARLPEPRPANTLIWLVPDPLAALQGFAAWWRLCFATLPVIGITGSVGKTTAKDVLAAALSRHFPILASPRSFNNEIGLPLTLLSLTSEHRAAVLEMGIYDVGDIAFLAGIARQNVGVVLNVAAVHLARAGSIERIAQAKGEMITTLPPDGIAILNHDDPRTLAMRAQAPGPVHTFGLNAGADWQGVDLEARPEGLRLTMVHQGERATIQTALPGAHHAQALLAAAAVMAAVGIPSQAIPATLEAIPAQAARQKLVRGLEDRLIIDDSYNASPLSVRAALDLLAAQPGPRRVAILADMLEMGEIAVASHREIGAYAGQRADLVIGVGPLARELTAAAGGAAEWFADKGALRPALAGLLRDGDIVLVKGSRGMAMEEVVGWLLQAN